MADRKDDGNLPWLVTRTLAVQSFLGAFPLASGAVHAWAGYKIEKWKERVEGFFDDARLVLMGQTNIEVIRFLSGQIRQIEKAVEGEVELKPEYEKLLTVPGIGRILALTIMLETGDIGRFREAGNYSSYCRCVKSSRKSNEKKKGENNRKNENAYLNWAYIEAANFIRRYCPEAKRWYQRKLTRSKQVVATKALSPPRTAI